MGGYIISREPRDPTISRYMSNPRCNLKIGRNNHPDDDGIRSPVCIEIADDSDEPAFELNPKTAHVIDEYTGYEQLLPTIAHGAFFLVDDKSPTSKDNCPPFPTAANSHLRQRHTGQLRSAATSRVNKPRRISPNTNGDSIKPLDGPHRSDLPKTPMSWSSEDDVLLRDLKELRKLGWKEISAYFPKRTAHACQFRWRRLVSGTLKGHKQCPPLPPTRASLPCLAIPVSSTLPESKGYLGAHDNVISTDAKIFDETPRSAESKGLVTSPGMCSPSSSYSSDSSAINRNEIPQSAGLSPSRSHLSQRYSMGFMQDSRELMQRDIAEREAMKSAKPKGINDAILEKHVFHTGRKCSNRDAGSLLIQGDWDVSSECLDSTISDTSSWTDEEDSLLLNRRLSFDEVSILLHHRSEEAIWSRMGVLRSSLPKSIKLECHQLTT
ncbi:hypothetical protein ABW19_dt0209619 [Dactylella cylindrospora]|nr:hypothetical protein ABW19_dt0209619 [Dactylella cylindrospora]